MTSYADSLPPLRCERGDGPHVLVRSLVDRTVLESPGGGRRCWCTRAERAVREHPVTRELTGELKSHEGYALVADTVRRALTLDMRGHRQAGHNPDRATDAAIRAAVHDGAVRDMRWTARGWHRDDLDLLHAATCVDEACPARAPGHSATVSVYGEKPHLGGRKT